MITPAIKDQVLSYLLAQKEIDIDVNFRDLYSKTGITYNFADMILKQFERMGLISYQGYMGG